MLFHVYILFSKKLNRFYIGSTFDMTNRLVEHNSGESTYTSTGTPWSLIWITTKPTKLEAESLERKLKNLTRQRNIRFMLKHDEGIIDVPFFKSDHVIEF